NKVTSGDPASGSPDRLKQEEVIRIMRDPHIGAMGAIGIIFILLLKWSLLASMPLGISLFNGFLILTPVLSRWAMVIGAALGPYPEVAGQGIGQPFIARISRQEVIIATVMTLVITSVISLIWSTMIGLVLMFISFIPVLLIVIIARKMLGGVNGDILGAINEIVEVTALFVAYLCYTLI
ncbi:MAG: adenosylcobinamide-GDP ribazoletransferase, partial [Planctomycetota bacterium]